MTTPTRVAPATASSARSSGSLNWALSLIFAASVVAVIFYSIMRLYPLVFELR